MDERDRERGAALIEFALLAPILFALLFGIVEFGFALNDYQSVRQGVRDGARQGVVGTAAGSTLCGLTGGALGASTVTKQLVCTTKSRVGLGNETRVKVVLIGGSFLKGNEILVCAQHPVQSITGFFSSILSGHQLESKVAMRIERNTSTPISAVQEDPPASGDWSWCTP